MPFDHRPDALGHGHCGRGVGVEQHRDILVPAVAHEDIFSPQAAAQQARHLDQHRAPNEVTVRIIDPLKVVEVHEEHAEWRPRLPSGRELAIDRRLQSARVPEPSQGVDIPDDTRSVQVVHVVEREAQALAQDIGVVARLCVEARAVCAAQGERAGGRCALGPRPGVEPERLREPAQMTRHSDHTRRIHRCVHARAGHRRRDGCAHARRLVNPKRRAPAAPIDHRIRAQRCTDDLGDRAPEPIGCLCRQQPRASEQQAMVAPQLPVLPQHAVVLQAPRRLDDQCLRVERLRQIMECAGAERAHGGLDRAHAREHDHAQVGVAPLGELKQLEPPHARHHQVSDQQVEAPLEQRLARRLAVLGDAHPIARRGERVAVQRPQERVVIRQQNVRRLHRADLRVADCLTR